jgi:hypothetical protein
MLWPLDRSLLLCQSSQPAWGKILKLKKEKIAENENQAK